MGDELLGEGGKAKRSSVSEMRAEEHIAEMRERDYAR